MERKQVFSVDADFSSSHNIICERGRVSVRRANYATTAVGTHVKIIPTARLRFIALLCVYLLFLVVVVVLTYIILYHASGIFPLFKSL